MVMTKKPNPPQKTSTEFGNEFTGKKPKKKVKSPTGQKANVNKAENAWE
jgi:hypothetical protein